MADFFENAPIGMLWLSADGTILHANRAQLDLLGYGAGEYVGRNVAEFLVEPELARKTLRQLVNGNVLHNLEAQLLCKGGAVKEVLIDAHVHWDPSRKDTGRRRFVYACCFTRDITERRAREKLILEISEREQQRIGQDLHDHLCQLLTGIRLRTILLEKKLHDQNLAEHKEAQVLADFLRDAVEQAHNVARGLHPVEFEEHGLMYALQELAHYLESVFGCRCECRIRKPVLIQNGTVAIHLYRIAQEAMTNGIKHGRSKKVVVQLFEKKGQVILSVTDDGVGFAEKTGMAEFVAPAKNAKGSGVTPGAKLVAQKTGLGLPLMKYRARMIGGQLCIEPRRGGGTIVSCGVPVAMVRRSSVSDAS